MSKGGRRAERGQRRTDAIERGKLAYGSAAEYLGEDEDKLKGCWRQRRQKAKGMLMCAGLAWSFAIMRRTHPK
ncbi:hypothetical protein V6N13_049270 [Hibiscus sabdariffa]